jgi:uncharacterized membrane protein YdbT with pleckstrin-like domain
MPFFGWNSSREMLVERWDRSLILFTVGTLIAPVFRYYFFKFHIAAGGLSLQTGYYLRPEAVIERIQSININQTFI